MAKIRVERKMYFEEDGEVVSSDKKIVMVCTEEPDEGALSLVLGLIGFFVLGFLGVI